MSLELKMSNNNDYEPLIYLGTVSDCDFSLVELDLYGRMPILRLGSPTSFGKSGARQIENFGSLRRICSECRNKQGQIARGIRGGPHSAAPASVSI